MLKLRRATLRQKACQPTVVGRSQLWSAKAEALAKVGGFMKQLGDVLIGLAVIAVILSIIGAMGTDIWLASTQWVLIGAVLSIWAVYVKIRE